MAVGRRLRLLLEEAELLSPPLPSDGTPRLTAAVSGLPRQNEETIVLSKESPSEAWSLRLDHQKQNAE